MFEKFQADVMVGQLLDKFKELKNRIPNKTFEIYRELFSTVLKRVEPFKSFTENEIHYIIDRLMELNDLTKGFNYLCLLTHEVIKANITDHGLVKEAISAMVEGEKNKTKKIQEKFCFPIGKYKLDMALDMSDSLVELSESEYTFFPKKFKGDKKYYAPSVKFLNFEWKLMLGTVDSKIYKIAPFIETDDKQYANSVSMAVLQYCRGLYGEPDKQETGLFIWDTADGNIVLQTVQVLDGFVINLFETSNQLRNFWPI
jgi:hypothetical protein